MKSILSLIKQKAGSGKKSLALLIDPDKGQEEDFKAMAKNAEASGVDYIFIGSSILLNGNFESCMAELSRATQIPLLLFPGNNLQVSNKADALLLLSLISGRNPEMLIGRHVISAPMLKQSGLEIIPTGYMLIDSGAPTSVSYMSGTTPIPHDKTDIAACTAMAGEMLGLQIVYMDAGSGARYPVSPGMIRAVKGAVTCPLIVGGGIRSAEKAIELAEAGADIIVVGNAVEKDPAILKEISGAVRSVYAS